MPLRAQSQTSVTLHSVTKEPPVYYESRQLTGNRPAFARRELEHMLDKGIIRPPANNWTSLLHLARKKEEGTGVPAQTTVLSTPARSLAGTPYRTYMTSQGTFLAALYSA